MMQIQRQMNLVPRNSWLSLVVLLVSTSNSLALEPIPDKLVVLTFDDSSKSHFTTARPILKKHGFGATFFITEGFDFGTNKQDYMTWEEIAELNRDGFEIGNHTRDHLGINAKNVSQVTEQLEAINQKCQAYGIPRTTSFAYPGNSITADAFPELAKMGIRFARRGGAPEFEYREGKGYAFEPGLDHPLLIPSAGDARPDWTLENFVAAVEQARFGRIAVLQFHGVPDTAHSWVNTNADRFSDYMDYLAKHQFKVIALRDLARYVDPTIAPNNWQGVIEDRKAAIAAKNSRENFRLPKEESELRYWLENMISVHRFTEAEVRTATGLTSEEVRAALARLEIQPGKSSNPLPANEKLFIRPYPGGRHPRAAFLDGAIRPQRETKFSAFLPWDLRQYVVVDVPEAIWIQSGTGRELLYLAHTHVPTMWSKQGIGLEPLEWTRGKDGTLSIERKLPNQIVFTAHVEPRVDSIRMKLSITNGTSETIRGLVVQNCVMLNQADGFRERSNDNKKLRNPYVACRNNSSDRWIITAWERCVRPWTNPPCPCMHSDPQFPDCEPGATQHLHGWLSFYEGTDVEKEFDRIEGLNWR